MSLEQVRLNLGLSQRELSSVSTVILDRLGMGKGVHRNIIGRCEAGEPISKVTATKLLAVINDMHTARRRPTLGIDDLTWTIAQRKRKPNV